MTLLHRTSTTPTSYTQQPRGRAQVFDKIYIGFVKGTEDGTFMGRLQVWIPELCGGDGLDTSTWLIMNYCTPFGGATNIYANKPNSNNYADSQRSYGMWFVPPDLENEVVCAFINGDPGKGIWMGCLYQQNMNNMVPGIAGNSGTSGAPVVEYNKRNTYTTDPNTTNRPEFSPFVTQLLSQGLLTDPVRGITSASARRPDPANSAYGILTPGGTQIVLDDDPANSHIRLRTVNGAQVLINDNTGCIYMNSVDGNNWVELSAGGEIDIYAQADISIRTQGSLNLHADNDINIEAGHNINMLAANQQNGPIPDITIFLDVTDVVGQIIGKPSYTYVGSWQSSATGQVSNSNVVFSDGLLIEFRRDVTVADNLIEYTVSGISQQSIQINPTIAPTIPNGGGFIKIEAATELHVLSQQNMYITSMKDMHRSSGKNMLDTAFGNLDRAAGGHIHDSSGSDYGILSAGNYVLSAPRVDFNGPAAPGALSATSAVAPTMLQQTDMEIITQGEFKYILTPTIMPRLPFHEPYTGHSSRTFGLNGSITESIPSSTTATVTTSTNSSGSATTSTSISTSTTPLLPGQIIAGQQKPLDLIGSPSAGMPQGRYAGQGYDDKGNPIYTYLGPTTALNPVSSYQISATLAAFVKLYEGLKYSVYKDPIGLPTVGYGHLLTKQENASNIINIGGNNVSLNSPLTQSQCDALLAQDLEADGAVYVRKFVKVPITGSQFDALVSFTFNLGGGRLQQSDLLKQLNLGNYSQVPPLFMNWTKAGGRVLAGLVTRRRAEATMFGSSPTAGV